MLDIRTVPLAELKPHPGNPRNSDTDAIIESLRANGQYQPLVVADDGVVLVGNHRYMAMMELGWETTEAVVVPYPSDDPRATKIMLADNRTTDKATYDTVALLKLIATLDQDIYGTGYDADDLTRLLAKVNKAVETPLNLGNQQAPPMVLSFHLRPAAHEAVITRLAEQPGDTPEEQLLAALNIDRETK